MFEDPPKEVWEREAKVFDLASKLWHARCDINSLPFRHIIRAVRLFGPNP
jgi:hypothetical protein